MYSHKRRILKLVPNFPREIFLIMSTVYRFILRGSGILIFSGIITRRVTERCIILVDAKKGKKAKIISAEDGYRMVRPHYLFLE